MSYRNHYMCSGEATSRYQRLRMEIVVFYFCSLVCNQFWNVKQLWIAAEINPLKVYFQDFYDIELEGEVIQSYNVKIKTLCRNIQKKFIGNRRKIPIEKDRQTDKHERWINRQINIIVIICNSYRYMINFQPYLSVHISVFLPLSILLKKHSLSFLSFLFVLF